MENESKEERERKKTGRGVINPALAVARLATRFSKDNQPDPEKIKAASFKRKRGRELIKAILELPFAGDDPAVRLNAAIYFGCTPDVITVEMMMVFKQIMRAVQSGDSYAHELIMQRAYGKPKDVPSDDENKSVPVINIQPIQTIALDIEEEDKGITE